MKLGDKLAQKGRKGDTKIGHLTTGEVIIPAEVMASVPGLAEMVSRAFKAAGADIGQYTVGGGDDSVNPATAMPEYGWSDEDADDNFSSAWSGGGGNLGGGGGGDFPNDRGSGVGNLGGGGGNLGGGGGGGGGDSGPNYGNIDFRDGPGWGQTLQKEMVSYATNYGGEGNTGSMPASAWKNQPTEAIGGVGFLGNSIAKRVDPATGVKTYGRSYNPGRMIGGVGGFLLGGPLGGMAGSMLGGNTAETLFNFSPMGDPGPREPNNSDNNSDDDRTAARQPTSTPSTTVTSPVLPLTAEQRRKRALARSPVSTTETLLGA
jgi:hypothetical protein